MPACVGIHVPACRIANGEETSDVLDPHEGGFDLPHDIEEGGEHVPLVGIPSALPGRGVWLARRSARNDVSHAPIRASVPESDKLADVTMEDGGVVEAPVSDAGVEDGAAEGVPLDVAHALHPETPLRKGASTNSGK